MCRYKPKGVSGLGGASRAAYASGRCSAFYAENGG
jgi:hypothetical protein